MSGPWEKYQKAEAGPWTKYQQPAEDPGIMDTRGPAGMVDDWKNLALGGVRGAARIGSTLLASPQQIREHVRGRPDQLGLSNLVNPDGYVSDMQKRGNAIEGGLRELGANPESLPFKAGDMFGQVAGTIGMGPALATGARLALPAAVATKAAPVLSAIESAGMTAGGLRGAAGVGTRAAGGAVTGGASAGLVDPNSAGVGAIIGGVLPGGIQLVGATAHQVGRVLRSSDRRTAEHLARALDITDPSDMAQIAAKLRAAQARVPGSNPTVAQTLRTPQAGILERVVSDSPGGGVLKARYDAQNQARLAALESVAPTNAGGFRQAQQDFGTTALDVTRAGDKAAKARTSAAYQSIPQDEAALYLPDLASTRDQYFPRGSFGGRAAVDDAVRVADEIGNVELAGIKPLRQVAEGQTLAQAVRKAGGVNLGGGLSGEANSLRGELKNLVRPNGGKSLRDLAESMHEAGFISENSVDALLDGLRAEARGRPVYSALESNTERAWQAASERAMGDAPAGGKFPTKVTLRQFDALRKSIGNAGRGAGKDPERATEAAALAQMKKALDDRIDEVVRGDGAIDENLPIAWADALTEAQRLKRAQVEKFRTGPQAEAFRMGSDGLPKVQGGEFAPKVWSNRPGIADDIKAFRKIMDDKPDLLAQFRSMITTQGASTQTATGNLTGKFAKWVDQSLPGLKASFTPEQVRMLKRIANDIRRAEAGLGAGMAKGSNTYQNAANALELGLLDNPLVKAASNRIPGIGLGVDWMREGVRKSHARRLAELLADPARAGNALQQAAEPPAALIGPAWTQNLLRAAPVLGAGR